MFANFFFLILNLLLISSAIDQTTSLFLANKPAFAFILFVLSYLIFLVFLHRQSPWLQKLCREKKERTFIIFNCEILAFFCLFYFFLGPQRWPVAHLGSFGISAFSAFSLLLYFGCFFLCHYSIDRTKNASTASNSAWLSTCFLLPFVIPFVLITFLSDAGSFIPFDSALQFLGITENNPWQLAIFSVLNLAIILSVLVFLPPLAVLVWDCPKLEDSDLKKELDKLCQRASFKHAGFRIWRIMNNSMTAAIIGVVSKWRYVLFTQKLLDHVPNRSIVAILAHEIGHSHYLHLFFYPFILLGMIVAGVLAQIYIYLPIFQKVPQHEPFLSILPLFAFLLFAATMAVYFRFIFGYFSRIFERQADLHLFNLNYPAAHMVEALNILGESAGNIHQEPNWHHYSIQQRMDFINEADSDRSLIARHNGLVRKSLFIYFIALAASLFLLGSNLF